MDLIDMDLPTATSPGDTAARPASPAAGRTVVAGLPRPRPFRPGSMPARLRPVVTTLLVAIGAWSGLLLLNAVGLGVRPDRLAGSEFGLMGQPGWGPPLVRVAAVVSLAMAAVAVTAAVAAEDWPSRGWPSRLLRRSCLVAVAVVGMLLLAEIRAHADILQIQVEQRAISGYAWLLAVPRMMLARVVCWGGLAAAVALPFVRLSGARSRGALLALAAAPFAGWLAGAVLLGNLSTPWLSNADWRGDHLYDLAAGLELLLVLYLAWELTNWCELVAGASAHAADRLLRGRRVVVGLLAAKLLWLALGYAGALPTFLGGAAAAWRDSAADGPGSWATALILAAAAVTWLARRGGAADAGGTAITSGVMLILVVLLCLPGLAAGALDAAARPLSALAPTGPFDVAALVLLALVAAGVALASRHAAAPADGQRRVLVALLAGSAFLFAAGLVALLDFFQEAAEVTGAAVGNAPLTVLLFMEEVTAAVAAHYFLAPGVAFVAAVALLLGAWRRGATEAGRRGRAAALAFAVTLAGIALLYVLPRTPQVPLRLDQASLGATGDLLAPQLSYQVYPLTAPAWERWWNGPAGGFEPATLDALLTVGLLVPLLLWWRRPDRSLALLGFVLVGSTVFAHSATLAPVGWVGETWFYLGFLFPVVLQLLYRGGELNQAAGRRPSLVLLSLALVLLLLTVLGYRLLIGLLDPSEDFDDVVFGYTRGFQLTIVLLPLALTSLALRLRGRPTAPAGADPA